MPRQHPLATSLLKTPTSTERSGSQLPQSHSTVRCSGPRPLLVSSAPPAGESEHRIPLSGPKILGTIITLYFRGSVCIYIVLIYIINIYQK